MHLLPCDLPMSPLNVEAGFDNCTRCGLCLTVCPTYQATRREMSSPRGRLSIMASRDHSPEALSYVSGCFRCAQCETVCPTSVPYARIVRNYLHTSLGDAADRVFEHRGEACQAFNDEAANYYLPYRVAPPIKMPVGRGDVLLLSGSVIADRFPRIEAIAIAVLKHQGYGSVVVDRNRWGTGLLEHGLKGRYDLAVTDFLNLTLKYQYSTIFALDPWVYGAFLRHRGSGLSPALPGISSLVAVMTTRKRAFRFDCPMILDVSPATTDVNASLAALLQSNDSLAMVLPQPLVPGGALPLMDPHAYPLMVASKENKSRWLAEQSQPIVSIDPITLLREREARHLLEFYSFKDDHDVS